MEVFFMLGDLLFEQREFASRFDVSGLEPWFVVRSWAVRFEKCLKLGGNLAIDGRRPIYEREESIALYRHVSVATSGVRHRLVSNTVDNRRCLSKQMQGMKEAAATEEMLMKCIEKGLESR